jgi:23S rRNA maturation-related 3'-5' exoribonuclease YhaM
MEENENLKQFLNQFEGSFNQKMSNRRSTQNLHHQNMNNHLDFETVSMLS